MADVRVLGIVTILICSILVVLWALLLTDGGWRTPWVWSNTYIIKIRMTLIEFEAQKGAAPRILRKLLGEKGYKKVGALFAKQVWLAPAVDILIDSGVAAEGPWRRLVLASRIMLACGGITIACLVVAMFLLYWHFCHKFQLHRAMIFGSLLLANLSAAFGVVQYGILTYEVRTDYKAQIGNGFLLACCAALLLVAPATTFRRLDKKASEAAAMAAGADSVEMMPSIAGMRANGQWLAPPGSVDPRSSFGPARGSLAVGGRPSTATAGANGMWPAQAGPPLAAGGRATIAGPRGSAFVPTELPGMQASRPSHGAALLAPMPGAAGMAPMPGAYGGWGRQSLYQGSRTSVAYNTGPVQGDFGLGRAREAPRRTYA